MRQHATAPLGCNRTVVRWTNGAAGARLIVAPHGIWDMPSARKRGSGSKKCFGGLKTIAHDAQGSPPWRLESDWIFTLACAAL